MNRIKELRKHKCVSQAHLSSELDVSQSTLSNWEKGTYEPDQEKLVRIADIFNVSVDYLIGRSDNPTLVKTADDLPLEGVYMRLGREAQNRRLPERTVNKILELMEEFAVLNGSE